MLGADDEGPAAEAGARGGGDPNGGWSVGQI